MHRKNEKKEHPTEEEEEEEDEKRSGKVGLLLRSHMGWEVVLVLALASDFGVSNDGKG